MGSEDLAPALAGRSADAERDAAVEVLARRLHRGLRDDGERQKALALLVRRGYELDIAYEAVRAFEADAA